MSDIDALVETVRSAIWGYSKPPFDRPSAIAALDELAGIARQVDDVLRGNWKQEPSDEGGPGKEETYWLRNKLRSCVVHLRDVEDYYRLRGGTLTSPNMLRADRARSLYEQISDDFINGKTTRPTMRERAEAAEQERDRLNRVADNLLIVAEVREEERDAAIVERDRLKAALREITRLDSPFGHSHGAFAEIARAALADVGGAQRHGRECPCTPCRREDWDAVDARIRRADVGGTEETSA